MQLLWVSNSITVQLDGSDSVRVSSETVIKYSGRAAFYLKVWLGKDILPSSLTLLLSGLRRSISILTYMWLFIVLLHNKGARFPKVSDGGRGGVERKWDRDRESEKAQDRIIIFYNIILEVTTHHFCNILFIRSQ